MHLTHSRVVLGAPQPLVTHPQDDAAQDAEDDADGPAADEDGPGQLAAPHRSHLVVQTPVPCGVHDGLKGRFLWRTWWR